MPPWIGHLQMWMSFSWNWYEMIVVSMSLRWRCVDFMKRDKQQNLKKKHWTLNNLPEHVNLQSKLQSSANSWHTLKLLHLNLTTSHCPALSISNSYCTGSNPWILRTKSWSFTGSCLPSLLVFQLFFGVSWPNMFFMQTKKGQTPASVSDLSIQHIILCYSWFNR